MSRDILLIAIAMILLIVGCRQKASVKSSGDHNTGQQKEREAIRKIDFQNYLLPTIACEVGEESNPQMVKVVNGKYRSTNTTDEYAFYVDKPVYADLDGDGIEEAIVATTCGLGANLNNYFGASLIYRVKGEEAELITSITGLFKNIKVKEGLITAEMLEGGTPMVKPLGHQAYRLVAGKIVAAPLPQMGSYKIEKDGKRRVTFERGSYSAVIYDKLMGERTHVYVMRANKDQEISFRIRSEGERVVGAISQRNDEIIRFQKEDVGILDVDGDCFITLKCEKCSGMVAYTIEISIN